MVATQYSPWKYLIFQAASRLKTVSSSTLWSSHSFPSLQDFPFSYIFCLVVGPPLWKIWTSLGMIMTFPIFLGRKMATKPPSSSNNYHHLPVKGINTPLNQSTNRSIMILRGSVRPRSFASASLISSSSTAMEGSNLKRPSASGSLTAACIFWSKRIMEDHQYKQIQTRDIYYLCIILYCTWYIMIYHDIIGLILKCNIHQFI